LDHAEAAGDPAAGAVSRCGEREPPRGYTSFFTKYFESISMAVLLTGFCSCLAMCAGDAGFTESLQGTVKRKQQA